MESYFTYIKDNEWEYVKEQYQDILNQPNQTKATPVIYDRYNEKLFTVKHETILFGLYNSYTLEAEPVTLVALSPLEDTTITIQDKSTTIQKDTPSAVTKIYPGTYHLVAKANNDFGSFSYENTLDIINMKEYETYIEFIAHTYTVQSNVPNASVLINDVDTGIQLTIPTTIGPFPNDTTATIQAQWQKPNGEQIISNAINLGEVSPGQSITLLFSQEDLMEESEATTSEAEKVQEEEQDEDNTEADEAHVSEQTLKENAGKHILDFRNAYELALNQQDFSIIRPYLLENSQVDRDLRQYINDLKGSKYHYDFHENIILNVSIISENQLEVMTNERFTFTNHRNEQIHYDRDKTYLVQYNPNGDYWIVDIEYSETNRSSN